MGLLISDDDLNKNGNKMQQKRKWREKVEKQEPIYKKKTKPIHTPIHLYIHTHTHIHVHMHTHTRQCITSGFHTPASFVYDTHFIDCSIV